jgi:ABC-2 type transport system ATP-binding protein
MISLKDLIKKFNTTLAVDIDKLDINEGEIFGIVGNNGAGKTTLFRLILDLLKPDRGEVLSKNVNVYQSEHWKKYTGSFIDDNFLIEFLTPDEYLEFIGFLYKMNPEDRGRKIDSFKSFMNGEISGVKKYIRNLSSGNKQKVGIIGAMLADPELLILDEPFNYLDPSSQINLKQRLINFSQADNKTIIISSHNLNHISEICSRIVLMERGKIIGDYENNSESKMIIEAYFGSQVGA